MYIVDQVFVLPISPPLRNVLFTENYPFLSLLVSIPRPVIAESLVTSHARRPQSKHNYYRHSLVARTSLRQSCLRMCVCMLLCVIQVLMVVSRTY